MKVSVISIHLARPGGYREYRNGPQVIFYSLASGRKGNTMMSLAQIHSESRKAASKAAKQGKRPFIVEAEDLADWKAGHFTPLPFPFIGSFVPKGWEVTAEYFVDSSGFGGPGEPALTIPAFINKLQVGYGYAITEAGQFQVYISEYRKGGTKPSD